MWTSEYRGGEPAPRVRCRRRMRSRGTRRVRVRTVASLPVSPTPLDPSRNRTSGSDVAMAHTHPNTSAPGAETALACSACAHLWIEHDQIAARYCTATMVGHHE